MKSLMVLALVLMLVVGVTNSALAITGGQPDGDAHPYVGMVFFPEYTGPGSYYLCSGSLISSTKFVTAAHCAPDNSRVSIYVPSVGLTGGWFDANSGYCITCGSGLQGFLTHDVAVVITDTALQAPRFANLPAANQVDGLAMNTPVDLVGFGAFERIHIPGTGAPDWGQANLVRRYAPTELVASNHKNADEFIRLRANASQGSGGTCLGDSGGPDLLGGTDTILAINSYLTNTQCAGVTYSNRIDVPDILNWIMSK
jgi:secreted trypsin-like serine protease